jgi:threonylcarbamoyladenosine tRNA methylthiotransferase MtaB
MDFVQRTGFGHLHIFAYSRRAGTRAADMPDQIPLEVKRARSGELHALGQRMKQALLKANLGRTRSILVEGIRADESGAYAAGYTPNYLPVRLRAANTSLANQRVMVRLESLTGDGEAINAGPLQ